jgi:hypothetical protein
MLFKFAMDVELAPGGPWIYGGASRNDRLAMKSAGHELKVWGVLSITRALLTTSQYQSAQALIDARISELHYPLMAAFTYRGKRVLCSSLLPVKGKETLVQGKVSPPLFSAPCCQLTHFQGETNGQDDQAPAQC